MTSIHYFEFNGIKMFTISHSYLYACPSSTFKTSNKLPDFQRIYDKYIAIKSHSKLVLLKFLQLILI